MKMTDPREKERKKQLAKEVGDYKEFRPIIESTIRDVYRYWLTAIPSKYPPNLNQRALSKDGRLERRDYLPVLGISKKEYIEYQACDAKYLEYLWEFTPKGYALEERMFLKIKYTQATYWSFGSCHSCWKQKKRNFTNTDLTPHPMKAKVDNPNLPRLGRCGCIICNECVMELELHEINKNEVSVHCPYCGNKDCFSKHMRVWLVSTEVSAVGEC